MSRKALPNEYVETPQPADVLFGRGSGPNDHEGNILFRSLVKERKAEYMATNHRQTKAEIAQDIVNHIRSRNGNFLKKAEPKDLKRLGLSEDSEVWCRVDEKTILEKAKQALRQKAETNKEDDKKVAPSPAAVKTKNGVPYQQEPPETVSHHFGQEYPVIDSHVMPEVYVSGELPVSQEQLDWRTAYVGSQEQMPGYLPQPPAQHLQQQQHQVQYVQSVQYNVPPGQAHLSEGTPPVQRYGDAYPQQGATSQGYHEEAAEAPVGDGPEDDARRKSLQVEDLMRSFHRMGTDEMATSSSDNLQHTAGSSNSNETMGTIEPLPMGASNQSMMTSSTFSILKGALNESMTPRDSITRPSNYKRDSSAGSGGKNDACDMSLSFSNLEGIFGDSGGNAGARSGNVSQVLEGENEDASNQKLLEEPRPLQLMEDDPNSLPSFGNSSLSILKSTLADSGDTSGSTKK